MNYLSLSLHAQYCTFVVYCCTFKIVQVKHQRNTIFVSNSTTSFKNVKERKDRNIYFSNQDSFSFHFSLPPFFGIDAYIFASNGEIKCILTFVF